MRCNNEFWVVIPEDVANSKEEIKLRVRFADLGDAVSTLNFKERRKNGSGDFVRVRAYVEIPTGEFARPALRKYHDTVSATVSVPRSDPIEKKLNAATHELARILTEDLGQNQMVTVEVRHRN